MKIYTTCVLPRALFACELWNDVTPSNMLLLERTHRLCLKSAQCLPKSTRSDMATSLLGTFSIESYMNEKKLLFLGTLCNMKSSDITNIIFVKRMFQFYNADTENNYGFFKDVNAILQTYELSNFLDKYRSTGHFPTYSQWKRVVREHVRRKEHTEWCARTSSDDFFRFRSVHHSPVTANIWRVAKLRPDSLPLMQHLARTLCAPASTDHTCEKCSSVSVNRLFHLVFECQQNNIEHKWLNFNTAISRVKPVLPVLLSQTDRQLLQTYFLGNIDATLNCVLNVEDYPNFLITCARHIKNLLGE